MAKLLRNRRNNDNMTRTQNGDIRIDDDDIIEEIRKLSLPIEIGEKQALYFSNKVEM